MRVLGADVASGRWVGVVLDDASEPLRPVAVTADTVGELADLALRDGALDAVGLDIPIGLPRSGRREAEGLARRQIGPRFRSVFDVPSRAVLESATYERASALSVATTGRGISRQSYALAGMILQVDAWVRTCGLDVVEVHPEVSFAAMAAQGVESPVTSHGLPDGKKTWAGALHRHRLLAAHGIDLVGDLPGDLGEAGRRAGVDDVLDAAAVAWTALRRARGLARSLPDPPQDVGDRWPAAIWA